MNDIREPQQLILPFDFQPVYRLDNFVVCSGNRDAFLSITDLCSGPASFKIVYLYGASGVGKTHLAQGMITTLEEKHEDFHHILLDCSPGTPLPATFRQYLEPETYTQLLVFENVDQLHLVPNGEDTMFELFNIFHHQEKRIIVTSKIHPTHLKNLHERLRSRFYSGHTIKIDHLDEKTCINILQKLASDHQVVFPEKIIKYLIMRVPRNPAFIQKIFHEVDALALKLRKPITINLVRRVLRHVEHQNIASQVD